MPCEDRQLTDAQRAAAFDQQRTGVTRGIRPFSGEATPENLAEYLNREVFPVLKQARDKINEVYLPVVDNAPSANPLAFYFSTETANADPTTGFIRLDNATQDTATTVRVSQNNARAVDVTPWLDVMSGSVTSPLGVVTLSHAINPGRYIRFDLDSMTDQGTYWDLGVTVVESSHDNPFALNDQIAIQFIPGVGSDGATVPAASLSAIADDTFLANISGAAAPPTAVALTTLAGAGLTYTAGGTLAVGAGTGISVSANDVAVTIPLTDGDKGHIVVSSSGATWLWDTTVSITGSQEIAPTGNLTLTVGGDLLANVTSGVFIGAGVTDTAVGTGNVELAGTADLICNFQSGVNITADATATGTAVGTGVIALNAPTNGVAITCGLSEENLVGAGDFKVNAASGIRLHVGATKQTTAAGVQISSETDVEATATDDITINAGDDLVLQTNSTTRVRINAAGDWDFENGLDFDVTGSVTIDTSGAGTDITLTAVDAISLQAVYVGLGDGDVTGFSQGHVRYRDAGAGEFFIQAHNAFTLGTNGGALSLDPAGDLLSECDTFEITGRGAADASIGLINDGVIRFGERSTPPTMSAGFGGLWFDDTAPTTPMYTDDASADWAIGHAAPNVLTSNQAATNATTNLTATSFQVPANTLRAGSAYRLQAYFTYLHTAAATPTLTIELLIGGSVVESIVVTPVSSAATYPGFVEATVVCRTTGAAGTVMCTLRSVTDAGSVIGEQLEGSTTTATDTVDTTAANTIELRMRMTTAVASNTLTIVQGWTERVA